MGGLKVHLGCWHRYIPGFIHVDLCDLPHIDYKTNIKNLPMFNDNSVQLIYSSHAIEYFDRDEIIKVLTEWYRVLCPGGILRLSVPDIEALIKIYTKSGDITKIIGPLYGKMTIKQESGETLLYSKTVYDERSLSDLLIQVGFLTPKRWDWRLTEHSTIDDHSQAYYPHMQKNSGILVSLNLEAKKNGL